MLLKPGNPLVQAPKDARVTLAIPRHGGAAYVVTEPATRGVATAEQYLNTLQARRATERRGYEPKERVNAILGSLTGRQLEAAWADGATRYREVVVAGLDGWTGFALVAWMPEATASRANGLRHRLDVVARHELDVVHGEHVGGSTIATVSVAPTRLRGRIWYLRAVSAGMILMIAWIDLEVIEVDRRNAVLPESRLAISSSRT